MTRSETAQKLAAMMSDLLQTPVDPDTPEALIIDDYGADSMDFMELADKVEMLFNIESPIAMRAA